MKITAKKQNLIEFPCDLLVLNLFEDLPIKKGAPSMKGHPSTRLGGGTGAVDKALGKMLARELAEEEIKGKLGESFVLHTHGKIPAKKVAVLGLGKRADFNLETVRRVGAQIVKLAKKNNVKRVGTIFHGVGIGKLVPRDAAGALVEGVLLANYEYLTYKGDEHKEESSRRAIKELTILDLDTDKVKAAGRGIAEAEINARATTYARDLVNEPASIMTPAHLVEHAREITKQSGGKIKLQVFDREECKKRGFGAFLGVAQGAAEEPYFVHLIYKGGSKKKIALVGKAITFDSGGLQIKPDTAMETMKLDMAGAAAVLGIFSVLKELDLPYEIHGIFAATENMPGGRAYKPGDIVRAMNGKTIEIVHTDAEGRVTLADSLSYAAALKPDLIVDLATLTGACMVALGEEVGGMFTNNDKLALKLGAAAKQSGEQFWMLPMVSEYREFIKSPVADVRNSGKTRYGGAITAALFLQEFVGDRPWIHLDIAGPAWAEREILPYVPVGGSGFGTRTILEFLRSFK